jgi:hypothetical protein
MSISRRIPMKSASRMAAVLVALLVLALAPAVRAGVDYSKNAAGGDYAPAVTTHTEPSAVASAGSGFAWGAAAIGAGAALVIVLVVAGMRGGRATLRARRLTARG